MQVEQSDNSSVAYSALLLAIPLVAAMVESMVQYLAELSDEQQVASMAHTLVASMASMMVDVSVHSMVDVSVGPLDALKVSMLVALLVAYSACAMVEYSDVLMDISMVVKLAAYSAAATVGRRAV